MHGCRIGVRPSDAPLLRLDAKSAVPVRSLCSSCAREKKMREGPRFTWLCVPRVRRSWGHVYVHTGAKLLLVDGRRNSGGHLLWLFSRWNTIPGRSGDCQANTTDEYIVPHTRCCARTLGNRTFNPPPCILANAELLALRAGCSRSQAGSAEPATSVNATRGALRRPHSGWHESM